MQLVCICEEEKEQGSFGISGFWLVASYENETIRRVISREAGHPAGSIDEEEAVQNEEQKHQE